MTSSQQHTESHLLGHFSERPEGKFFMTLMKFKHQDLLLHGHLSNILFFLNLQNYSKMEKCI